MGFYAELLARTEAERAEFLAIPLFAKAVAGQVNLATYQSFLTQAYHHVKHTVPLLMAVGARLPERLEWLREAVAEYVREEYGHQEWVLGDIHASDGDAEAVRHGVPALATDRMVAYAWDTVMRRNPVGFFGMVLVLEGTSVNLATRAARAIQSALQLPDAAFSYLTSHGELDQSHIGYFEGLMDRLDDPSDQSAVLWCARQMYGLYGDVFRSVLHASQA